jgi:NADH-quinone oxidoreductase subunit N
MTVFMLSLAGIPPTAGFWGKFYVFEAAIREGYVGLAIIALLNSALAMFYYLRVVVVMYMRDPVGEAYEGQSLQVSAAMLAAAIAILWIGLFPGPVSELARLGTRALAASF